MRINPGLLEQRIQKAKAARSHIAADPGYRFDIPPERHEEALPLMAQLRAATSLLPLTRRGKRIDVGTPPAADDYPILDQVAEIATRLINLQTPRKPYSTEEV